jgi:hypothetical protein
MSLIIPANSLAGGGYAVDNSLRFASGSSDYLNRTSGTSTDTKKLTFSFWVKRGNSAREQHFLNSSGSACQAYFASDDKIYFTDGTASGQYKTTQVFRDFSAWYHFVFAEDTTQATASDRIKIYVNGTQITAFDIATTPTLNAGSGWNANSTATYIGRYNPSPTGYYYDGYLSEFNFIDGQALTPTDFGEFDADSGVWKPIAYSGTYGTNGFFLEFQDSGALGTDTSGEGNNFTVNNLTSIDQTTDTPTNNFCTMNALLTGSNITLKEGNTFTAANTAATGNSGSTFQIPETGKWYFEVKLTMSTGDTYPNCGIKYDSTTSQGSMNGGAWNPDVYVYGNYPAVKVYVTGGTNVTSGSAYATDDIARFAIDQDNGAIYVSQNETWWNSGNPESGASKTGAVRTFTAGDYPNMTCCTSEYNDSITKWNFGNPAYTITTGNADANNYGNFEYAVPSGYLSLCTKNLSEVNS